MSSTALNEPDASAAQFQRSLGRLVLGQNGTSAAWEEPSLKALARLLLLPANWDSYGARPVNPACVWAAWQLLTDLLRADSPAPSVVPTVRGGVQLEWHRNGVDFEIEIDGPGRLSASFEVERTGESWEKADDVTLAELTADLACALIEPTSAGRRAAL